MPIAITPAAIAAICEEIERRMYAGESSSSFILASRIVTEKYPNESIDDQAHLVDRVVRYWQQLYKGGQSS